MYFAALVMGITNIKLWASSRTAQEKKKPRQVSSDHKFKMLSQKLFLQKTVGFFLLRKDCYKEECSENTILKLLIQCKRVISDGKEKTRQHYSNLHSVHLLKPAELCAVHWICLLAIQGRHTILTSKNSELSLQDTGKSARSTPFPMTSPMRNFTWSWPAHTHSWSESR